MKSAGKVMGAIFWDANGIIFIDYSEKGKPINGEYHAPLLAQLGNEIKRNRPHMARKKMLFHQDNARVHTCAVAIAKLHELKFELLLHSPYLPNLDPSNFFLFPNMKKWLVEKRFESKKDVITEREAYFEELPKS